mmetsp:Transcript_16290/g.35331  ORF Transcript_16290/g.35331 Transcript_16290/m.35331 type:complete len:225 (-) Transcript_16290:56-730(-)
MIFTACARDVVAVDGGHVDVHVGEHRVDGVIQHKFLLRQVVHIHQHFFLHHVTHHSLLEPHLRALQVPHAQRTLPLPARPFTPTRMLMIFHAIHPMHNRAVRVRIPAAVLSSSSTHHHRCCASTGRRCTTCRYSRFLHHQRACTVHCAAQIRFPRRWRGSTLPETISGPAHCVRRLPHHLLYRFSFLPPSIFTTTLPNSTCNEPNKHQTQQPQLLKPHLRLSCG